MVNDKVILDAARDLLALLSQSNKPTITEVERFFSALEGNFGESRINFANFIMKTVKKLSDNVFYNNQHRDGIITVIQSYIDKLVMEDCRGK